MTRIEEVVMTTATAVGLLDEEVRHAFRAGDYSEANRLVALQMRLKNAVLDYRDAKDRSDPPPFVSRVGE